MNRFAVALTPLLSLSVFSCSSTPPPATCGPAICNGCCDSAGVCQPGNEAPACGKGGAQCSASCGQVDAGTDGGTDAGMTALCESTAPACSDQAIQQMDLKKTVAPGTIKTVEANGVFTSTIDATAGGLTPTQSYVYARFGTNVLEKVAISDEASLDSLDWDIAFRRFVIRLNGGTSGPSCVGAAPFPGQSFEQATSEPGGAVFKLDKTFTDPPACMFEGDGSGLGTSPSTALANPEATFYNYTSCVRMTHQVFAVRTRQGRMVKLEVMGYYATEAAQELCQNGQSPNASGGTLRVRWAYLN